MQELKNKCLQKMVHGLQKKKNNFLQKIQYGQNDPWPLHHSGKSLFFLLKIQDGH